MPVEASRQRDGVRWLDAEREARGSLTEVALGQLGLRQLLDGLRGVRVDAAYAADDSVPAAREAANGIGRDARRLVNRVRERRGTAASRPRA